MPSTFDLLMQRIDALEADSGTEPRDIEKVRERVNQCGLSPEQERVIYTRLEWLRSRPMIRSTPLDSPRPPEI